MTLVLKISIHKNSVVYCDTQEMTDHDLSLLGYQLLTLKIYRRIKRPDSSQKEFQLIQKEL